jgi:hypothetical protein
MQRASIAWSQIRYLSYLPRLAYIGYIGECFGFLSVKITQRIKGVCVQSVYSQMEALNHVEALASAAPSFELSDITGSEAIIPVQVAFQGWRRVDLLGSLSISTICSTLIAARLLLMQIRCTAQPKLQTLFWRAVTILLDSGLVFAPIGAIAVYLRKDMHEIVFVTAGPFESSKYSAPYLNHFMDTLWINALVSDCQTRCSARHLTQINRSLALS